MARKTAEEMEIEAMAQQNWKGVAELAASAASHVATIDRARQQHTHQEVSGFGPPRAVPLPNPYEARSSNAQILDEHPEIQLIPTAPVVADSTKIRHFPPTTPPEGEEPREPRYYVVLGNRLALDGTSKVSTTMREGKIICDKHYNVLNLARQGVKLKQIPKPAPENDEELLRILTAG